MTVFFTAAIISYFLVHFLMLYGIRRSYSLKQISHHKLPRVTLIVAAKNEEAIIAHCISFLKKLEYDRSLLEIYLVNDKSDDRTKEIMLKETEGLEHFVVIDSETDETGNLKGKANAIDTAIRKCKGEIIFTTDADCEAPPEWIKETVSYYDDETGLIGGFTNIDYSGSLFNKIQSLDWVYLHSLASGSAGINSPIACIGNNMSFRKEAYIEAGGFGKIAFSITEDLALMREIDKSKKYSIKYPINPKCLMKTVPCPDIKTLARQKKRWLRGATDVNWLGFLMAAEYLFMNIVLVAGYAFFDFKSYLLLVGVIILAELICIIPIIKIFKLKKLLIYYPFFKIYFTIHTLLTPMSFLFGKKLKWKGREF